MIKKHSQESVHLKNSTSSEIDKVKRLNLLNILAKYLRKFVIKSHLYDFDVVW